MSPTVLHFRKSSDLSSSNFILSSELFAPARLNNFVLPSTMSISSQFRPVQLPTMEFQMASWCTRRNQTKTINRRPSGNERSEKVVEWTGRPSVDLKTRSWRESHGLSFL